MPVDYPRTMPPGKVDDAGFLKANARDADVAGAAGDATRNRVRFVYGILKSGRPFDPKMKTA